MTGAVVPLVDVPDRVFADRMLGPGIALGPDRDGPVLAPVDGIVVATRPHALVLRAAGDHDVLVHLGLDTHAGPVSVDVAVGTSVIAGAVVGRWCHDAVLASGQPPLCPVVVLDASLDALTILVEAGQPVRAGEPVLRLPDPGRSGPVGRMPTRV